MKLKNLLVMAFLIITLIPIAISSILLYKSGYDLSKESYVKNLAESIGVQADYITQTLEDDMISNSRFERDVLILPAEADLSEYAQNEELFSSLRTFLQTSEDKISVAFLLDKENVPIYSIGEKTVLDAILPQLLDYPNPSKQEILEISLNDDGYSLGIITPVYDKGGSYNGRFVTIYNPSYIFKIISSYYEIADSSTYLCRENGEIINSRGLSSKISNPSVEEALDKINFASEGSVSTRIETVPVSGYYKNIYKSNWYLVGFIDDSLIYSFINQYVLVYILIIVFVLVADLFLAFYFSNKVVSPINHLIEIMDGYQNNLVGADQNIPEKNDYYETRYLRTKFFNLMKTILLVQHNFQGVYQLYQSNDMGDINIELDVKEQIARSNKETFQTLMDGLVLPNEACIVERFTNCFCEKDQRMLMDMFEGMRDKHLSVTRETEIYTPYLGQKWFHTLVVPMYNDNRLSNLFIQLRDISGFKKQEFESSEQARRDFLTGLYNRSGFIDCVSKILGKDCTDSLLHGLLFIDMDYFKLVNDNFGHGEGDVLLQTVAHTITSAVAPSDIVSRFGGDEFAVFLPHTTLETMQEKKEQLEKLLVYPYQNDQVSFTVSASIGSSTWNHDDPSTLEHLLQQADASMYQAKREFKQNAAKK